MSAGADRLPIVVLISGSGSNLRAIAECARGATLPVEIRAVISDRSAAAGLAWAANAGLPAIAISPRDFADRAAFDRALADRIEGYSPRLVVLAGFMRILGREFVERFAGRMLNIHPSLLPRHRGLHTHQRAWGERSLRDARTRRWPGGPTGTGPREDRRY
jgi:phosphoribosylglycinamide formyltransferase 1